MESIKWIICVPTRLGPVGAGTAVGPETAKLERTATAVLTPFVYPTPVKLTCCGLSVLPSAMERLAVRVPLADGLNVTLIVQDDPAPTLELQVFVCE